MTRSIQILGVWITDPADFASRVALGIEPKLVVFIFVRGGLSFRYAVLNPSGDEMRPSGTVKLNLSTFAYEVDDNYLRLYDVNESPDSEPFVAPWQSPAEGRLQLYESGDWSYFVAETSTGAAERLGIPYDAFLGIRAEIEDMGYGWVDKGVIEAGEA